MAVQTAELREALERWFGFPTFRPSQEAIVRDVLDGRDVFALLPTGGGKSLCYQLPAVLTAGLTVVISPLIALMKDQVDALDTAGIGATALNSSLEWPELRRRLDGLERGEYKLLYVAPERLTLPGFADDLERWNVARFVVDEAHCISEWGHDFRPEYRRIAPLRERFPDVAVLRVHRDRDGAGARRRRRAARAAAPRGARRFVRPRESGVPRAALAAHGGRAGEAGCARGPMTKLGSSTRAAAPTPRSSRTRCARRGFRRSRTTPGSTPRRAASGRRRSSATTCA